LAASKDDEESTIEVIKTLQTFGEHTAKAERNAATEQVAETLGAVGEISAGKGKAFEEAVSEVAKSLEEVGKAAVGEEGLEQATEHVATALGAVGKEAAGEGLEKATESTIEVIKTLQTLGEKTADKEKKLGDAVIEAATSLGAVGVTAAVNKLEAATQSVASSLGEVGKAAVNNQLEDATIRTIKSLKEVGKAAAKMELRAATEATLLYLFEIEKKADELEEPEDAIKEAISSLGEVGKAAAEYKLPNETKKVASFLLKIGKADVAKKFKEQVAKCLDALTTFSEKRVKLAINDYKASKKTTSTSLEKFLSLCKEGL
jgi:hypothetical protein